VSPIALIAAPLATLLGFQRPSRREALLAALLAVLVVWGAAGAADGFARAERAWVFLLVGGLVVALALRPPAVAGMLTTALVAVATAGASAAVLIGVTEFSWAELHWLATRHFGAQARLVIGAIAAATAGSGARSELVDALEASALAGVRLVSQLLPGLVLLQSVAALALAWALYRLVARKPEGTPLPPLREFRFNDHLIWGVVLALVALAVPGLHGMRGLGGNLAVFFGGLYVVRGLAVVAALAAATGAGGAFAAVAALLVALFLMPIAAAVALGLGVTDTWVDWRRLTRAARR
jgi:hypothetical protein